jgi:spore coat protein H
MKTIWSVGVAVLILFGCSENSVEVFNPGNDLTQSQLDSIRIDSLKLDSIANAESLKLDSTLKEGSYLTGSSKVVFNQDSIYTFKLTIKDSLWQLMNANAGAEEYFPANLTVKKFELGKVAIRYKGSFGSLTSCTSLGYFIQGDKCDKLSMKIKFSEYQKDLRFFGLKKLNFHAMMHDPSLMRDRVAYKLYSEMGVEAPRATHANVVLNGKPLGVFVMVEQVDGRFTADRFPENGNGNLYKESWPQHTVGTPYTQKLKTNEEASDVQGMIDFTTWLKTPMAERNGSVADWMDVDKTLSYLAVEDVINNWDGSSGWYCWGSSCGPHNFYMYEAEDQHGFQLIPWDLDVSLHAKDPYETVPAWNEPYDETNCKYFIGVKVSSGAEMLPPICDPLMTIFATKYESEYDEKVSEFLKGPFSEVESWIDEWVSQIQSSVELDTLRSKRANWLSEVQKLKADISILRELAQAKLDGIKLEKLKLYTEKLTDFELLTPLMVQSGVQSYNSSNSTYNVELSEKGLLVGDNALELKFVYTPGDKWSGWTKSSVQLDKPSVDMNQQNQLKIWLKADRPRNLRIGIESSNYKDKDSGGNYGWDIKVSTEAKEYVLSYEDLKWTSWDAGNASKNPIDKALEAVHGLSFSTSPASFNSSGFMEEGSEEVGFVLLDNIEFD